jgi:predicted RNA-binding protein with PIN domain
MDFGYRFAAQTPNAMLILIDGYNVIAPIAAPGRGATERWLQAERERLIELLYAGLGQSLSSQTTVVFDAAAAPPGLDSRYVVKGIEVEFAIGYAEADDRLEELIAEHSSPKRLTVVSSDRRVKTAATRRGALAVDSDVWLDRLSDGHIMLANRATASSLQDESHLEKPPAVGDVDEWLNVFGMEPGPSKSPESKRVAKSREIDNPFPPGYGEDLL